jgi:hypothetical protein
MTEKCEHCPLYKLKLEELLNTQNSNYDIVIDIYEFIKHCNCVPNKKDLN